MNEGAANSEMTGGKTVSGDRPRKFTVPDLLLRKQDHQKIVALTAYDYSAARLADRAGMDIVLVGDTLGIMSLGYSTTIPVTMAEMLHHVKACRRGVRSALLVVDMPFGSYQVCVEDAVRNASLLIKEGGAQAVKIEGGAVMAATVRRLSQVGIPVMGHLGLQPQSVNSYGGNRAQGRDTDSARQLREDALILQAEGAFAIVLEAIPAELSAEITSLLSIPTIGIGAGPDCDGQVQVWHDILGIYPGKKYRHVKQYAELGELIDAAIRNYSEEVRGNNFPTKEHSL